MSTKTFHGVARLVESQAAEIDRLRRIVALIPPYRQPPVYSNYQPRRRFEQTRP